jgi:hypothetical protein
MREFACNLDSVSRPPQLPINVWTDTGWRGDEVTGNPRIHTSFNEARRITLFPRAPSELLSTVQEIGRSRSCRGRPWK